MVYHVTPLGAGTKDGSDWDNAFGATEFFDWFVSGTQLSGDVCYVMSGTYTLVSSLVGTVSTDVGIIGVCNEEYTIAKDDERPLVVMGAYYFRNTYYWKLQGFRGTGTGKYGFWGDEAIYIDCSYNFSGTPGTAYGFWAGTIGRSIYIRCYCDMDNTTLGTGFFLNKLNNRCIGCYATNCYVGFQFSTSCHLEFSIATNCRTGLAGWIWGTVINNIFAYCESGYYSPEGKSLCMNNIFYSCDIGLRSIDTFLAECYYNNFYNNIINRTSDGSTENPDMVAMGDQELDPQFKDPENGDFTLAGENLKAKGFPSDFPDGINKSYLDMGACQREEPTVDYPLETDVRKKVIYSNGDLVGSAYIPSADDTRLDVPVDDTVGTVREALESDVRNGSVFGANDSLVGNLTLTSAGNIAEGVGIGSEGVEIVGTRTDADPDKVLTDNGDFGDPSDPKIPNWTKADKINYVEGETFGINGTSEIGELGNLIVELDVTSTNDFVGCQQKKIYTETIGLQIVLNLGIDLTEAIYYKINMKKPDGSIIALDASKALYEGELTRLYYETVASDLDLCGVYELQPEIRFADGSVFFGVTKSLTVLKHFT